MSFSVLDIKDKNKYNWEYICGGPVSQIAIYIEDELEEKMNRAAKNAGQSRSAWVKEAILLKISAGLPESWFKLWGSWEDDRSAKEILSDIDAGYAKGERAVLR